jgi:GT2 family glycosyltransferase
MTIPTVSVIIVNWNGESWLPNCLNALRAQTFFDFETIIVDNASSDSSVALIEGDYPEVTLVRNDRNDGFAKGNNIGYFHAQGRYILLLNNDTESHPALLENMLAAFAALPKAGSVQAKLVLIDQPDRLDACGAFFTASTVSYHFGYGKDAALPIYNQPAPMFSNKGACMMLRREVIESVGLFDDDFWCYYEETDLCHRIWLAGWECWYWPHALCKHGLGGTSNKIVSNVIQFHNFKNKLTSHIKNFSSSSLVWVLPMHFLVGFGYSMFFLFTGKWRNALAFIRGTYWVFENLGRILKKRHAVQRNRTTSDRNIFRQSLRNPRIIYYFYFFTNLADYPD